MDPRGNALLKLNQAVLDQNKTPLSSDDLNLILKDNEPEMTLSLLLALDKKRVNSDRVLVQAVDLARTSSDLIPIAFSLRYGANPNIYVRTGNEGEIHIIAFAYIRLKNRADRSVLDAIIIMLYISGARYVLPYSSERGGGIRYMESRKLAREESVIDGLGTKGYANILDRLNPNYTNIEPSFLLQLATLLDQTDLVALAKNRIAGNKYRDGNITIVRPQVNGNSNGNQNGGRLRSNDKGVSNGNRGVSNVNKDIIHNDDFVEDIIWQNVRLKDVIMAHSYEVLAVMISGKKGKDFLVSSQSEERWKLLQPILDRDNLALIISLYYLNLPAFRVFLRLGYLPDYITVNQMLIDYRLFLNIGDRIAAVSVFDMLEQSVLIGTQLDPYQYNMLQRTDPNAARRILDVYQTSYWSKSCRTPYSDQGLAPGHQRLDDSDIRRQARYKEFGIVVVPDQANGQSLSRLAFELGLPHDIPKSQLCQHLERISKNDATKLAQQAEQRQMTRISTTVSTPDEYAEGANQQRFLCRNRAVEKMMGRNPYHYNDDDLVFYRDESDAVWCYISDEFPSLLADQVNPITNQPLPSKTITEMKHKQVLAKEAGLPLRDPAHQPLTYQQVLSKLTAKDSINNKANERIEQAFFETARIYGIYPDDIHKLKPDQAQAILNDLAIGIRRKIDLTDLHISHKRMTFIRVLYQKMLHDPSSAQTIFNYIKVIRTPTTALY